MKWEIFLFTSCAIAGAANLRVAFRLRDPGARWIHGGMGTLLLLMAALPAYILEENFRGGCYPWSPSDVEFTPGMTLCPGQTAVLHGTIQLWKIRPAAAERDI